MKKTLSKVAVLASAVLLSAVSLGASVADNFPVPASDAKGLRGATVPYTRYDCNSAGDARLSGGATIKTSPDWDPYNKASQASNQAYVDMPVGSSVAWTMKTYGDGVTIRYTIKDSNVGSTGYDGGYKTRDGQLEVYVNGQKKATVDLTSYFMYQYFPSGHPSQGPDGRPCFVFDEKHVNLGVMAKEGDTIEIKCIGGDEVGVDFIETEVVPEAIEASEAAAGRQVFNVVDYGASTSSTNNVPAFNKAISAANAVGGVVYIPEGTWLLGEMWSLAGHDIKITGAGMWHTNLQFTGYKAFGGGISGGNPSNGPFKSNQCDNIEFCNVYINSNLCDRYNQQAVYKCFMDIWCGGSVIHDVWEEHFETGFWFGDYNSNPRRCSDGVRVVNCRIRNNYADGVNFCQGTSEAAVFNCNIRNCGDDGLACWNNNEGVKDEYGNIFCFNTIDHIWRAGAIALYGGKDHKIYNNYICDTFMASGIHLNTNFPGPKFQNITADSPVIIENNTLVRCGTMSDSWNESLGAIDLIQSLNHIILRNNSVFESPADALRTLTGPENITIDGLYINGAGLSKASDKYSCVAHSFSAGRIEDANAIKFSNVRIVRGSIPAPTEGANQDSFKTWPWWSHAPSDWEWTEEVIDAPVYPDSKGIIPVPDPFETLTGYDLVLTGIDWSTQSDKHSMYDGDKVSLRLRIDNKGTADIPADSKFTVVFSIDGTSSFSVIVKDGLAANSSRIIEIPSTWTATKGMHTFTATIDPSGKCKNDANRDNNVRVKDVNVNEIPEGEEPEIEINTHSGSDMGVVKVWFENLTSGDDDVISVGDILRPHAIVANYGSTTITLGKGQGVLWGLGSSSPEYGTGMLWDDSSHTLAPGQSIEVTPNGGGNFAKGGFNDDCTVTATAGTVTLTGRMDNPEKYNDNESSNDMLSASFTYPKARPQYNEDPDRADNLENGGYWDYEDEGQTGGGDNFDTLTDYDLVMTGIDWTTQEGKHSMYAGDNVSFRVRIDNKGKTDIPAGANFVVTLGVDKSASYNFVVKEGLAANSSRVIEFAVPWIAVKGTHTFTATIDPSGKCKNDANRANNVRTKDINVYEHSTGEEPEIEINTHNGSDMGVVKVWFENLTSGDNSVVSAGDILRPHAIVANYGSTTITLGKGQGVLWGIGSSSPEYGTGMLWDDSSHTLAPGQYIDVTPNGGGNLKTGGFNDDFTVTAENGSVTLTSRMDNPDRYSDNTSSNNSLSATFIYPLTNAGYIDNPDRADNLVTGGFWDYEDTESPDIPTVTGFDLVPTHIFWEPGTKEVQAGQELYDFTVRVSNLSAVDFPADIPVKVTVTVDGRTVGSATYSDGIYAGEYYNLNIDGTYLTTGGAHTVRATVAPVAGESDRTNNLRERTFNARSSAAPEPATFALNPNAANSSLAFVIDRVEWFKEPQSRAADDNVIRPGDKLRFRAYVRNNSASTSPANTKHGIQWQMPAGNTSDIIWSDEHQGKPGVAPGETIVLTSMGGKDNGLWTAQAGTTTVRAWFNDTHDLKPESQYECQFDFPVTISDGSATVTYHENPLGDDKEISSAIETLSSDDLNPADDVWYNLAGIRIQGRPMFPGIYIHNGKKVMVK